jgi:uncharacterized protein (TIGR02444 family)
VGLWDWALAAYARPGVAPVCLALQDGHHQNIPLLLAAAWAAEQGRTLDLDRAVALARVWEADVVGPLRGARRGLKISPPPVPDSSREALRETVKAVELEAERLLFSALESLAWPGEVAPVEAAVTAAAVRWSATKNSSPPPADGLSALSSALLG